MLNLLRLKYSVSFGTHTLLLKLFRLNYSNITYQQDQHAKYCL